MRTESKHTEQEIRFFQLIRGTKKTAGIFEWMGLIDDLCNYLREFGGTSVFEVFVEHCSNPDILAAFYKQITERLNYEIQRTSVTEVSPETVMLVNMRLVAAWELGYQEFGAVYLSTPTWFHTSKEELLPGISEARKKRTEYRELLVTGIVQKEWSHFMEVKRRWETVWGYQKNSIRQFRRLHLNRHFGWDLKFLITEIEKRFVDKWAALPYPEFLKMYTWAQGVRLSEGAHAYLEHKKRRFEAA